jgi:flagellar P-ring protein precursor FlgI
MMRRFALLAALVLALPGAVAHAQARIGDLVVRPGETPRRVVGYGLVTGLDGTGDRSFGGFAGETPTVRSIINLLKRFNILVPPTALQARNVAAVLVTAELSPYLRSGGRFEVQVASLGDATSLRGGVLFMTPLLTDPNQPPIATAQGALLIGGDDPTRGTIARRGTAGRIPEGGILEVDPPPVQLAGNTVLQLKKPDLLTATRIAAAINAAFGGTAAKVTDPGAVQLTAPQAAANDPLTFLAAIDSLPVTPGSPARIMISARDGSVTSGGDVRIGTATVSHKGITLRIGGPPAAADSGAAPKGSLTLAAGATVQDVAAGLHAVGATSQEVAAIFESLAQVGALTAQVAVR